MRMSEQRRRALLGTSLPLLVYEGEERVHVKEFGAASMLPI